MGSVAAGARSIKLSGAASSAGDRLRSLPVEGELPSLKHAVGWLNSSPLEKADLRGKTVLVNFWTYTCINSLRTLPYMRAWAEKYRDAGLVVIGVHTPEFAFEHDVENVRRAVKEIEIAYAVAVDSGYEIWNAFGNQYWPAFYLADEHGRIRHHQFGEGQYEQMERAIQQSLREAGQGNVGEELVAVNARGIEAAPDWANLKSPESYVGFALAQNFVSRGREHSYVIPSRLELNHWALEGDWNIGKEAAVLNKANGRIAYHFHARDLHLVMTPPSGKSVRFRVSIDGMPPQQDHGLDIDAEGYGTLSEPRLHQLIRQSQPAITSRQCSIEFLDAGAQIFDFTFG